MNTIATNKDKATIQRVTGSAAAETGLAPKAGKTKQRPDPIEESRKQCLAKAMALASTIKAAQRTGECGDCEWEELWEGATEGIATLSKKIRSRLRSLKKPNSAERAWADFRWYLRGDEFRNSCIELLRRQAAHLQAHLPAHGAAGGTFSDLPDDLFDLIGIYRANVYVAQTHLGFSECPDWGDDSALEPFAGDETPEGVVNEAFWPYSEAFERGGASELERKFRSDLGSHELNALIPMAGMILRYHPFELAHMSCGAVWNLLWREYEPFEGSWCLPDDYSPTEDE